ncbi:hypothetical protein FGW37_09270 [Streptomyces rectiverticillatus]|uniref:HNH endonuclease n=1 Tax=Streptomyces rectiverticillatus TaxID=173860 RepID=UPI0015C3121E|nr:HNH endonuclease signature motif containing protein [Streptomyces rectiverticillatus]QLE71775.1 hypothetical protein FGW37_09270 [Streptomyces rectiverticillatus]
MEKYPDWWDAQQKEYKERDLIRRIERKQRRRSAEHNVEHDGTPPHVVYAKTDGLCIYCQEQKAAHIDHVRPVSRGGPWAYHNLVPACADCNTSKNDQIVRHWWTRKTGRPFDEIRIRLADAGILARWTREPTRKEETDRHRKGLGNIDPENPNVFLKSQGGYWDAMYRSQAKKTPSWFRSITKEGPLSGITIILSGTPYGIQNKEWRQALRQAGGRVGQSVSSRTDAFVTDGQNHHKTVAVQTANVARDKRGLPLIEIVDARDLLRRLHQHLPAAD